MQFTMSKGLRLFTKENPLMANVFNVISYQGEVRTTTGDLGLCHALC